MKEDISSPLIINNLNTKTWSSIFFSYRQPAVAAECFALIFFFNNQTIKLLMKLMLMVMMMVMFMVMMMVMVMVMVMVKLMVMMMVMLEAVFFVRQSGSGTSGNFVHPGSLQRRG